MQCLNCSSGRLVYRRGTDSYECLDCHYRYPKQYFFVSHSHLDIEKVRIIRNIIEETFFYEPILFFLKCLSDEEEIQSLIRREIYERIWFVYCKSENAENSKYVRAERAYLQKLVDGGKKINVLNIELDKFNIWDSECYDYIRGQIAYQIRKTKPYICYSGYDSEAARAVYECLTKYGYNVWINAMEGLGGWYESVKNSIKQHSYKDGCILLLVSEKSVDSRYVRDEISYALEQKAFILPVILHGGENCRAQDIYLRLTGQYPALSGAQYLKFDISDPYSSAEELVKQLQNI